MRPHPRPSPRQPPEGTPHRVDFHRTKYGRELLVDAARVSTMPTFFRDNTPHTLSFHDILIVTRGRGRFWLDGVPLPIQRGGVFFTRPGQVRQWEVTGLDGACLFFAAEFVEDFFRDPRFLHDLAYFRVGRPSPEVGLPPARLRAALRRFGVMVDEIRGYRADTEHLLRAILYELLVSLERDYIGRWGPPGASSSHPLVDRFVALVEQRFRQQHRLAIYARDLGVTPGHLRHLCRIHLGHSAGVVIRQRLTVEARRLLRHSGLTIAVIAATLGFADPSYFGRFVRRETGQSPGSLRAWRRGHPSA